MDIDPTGDPTHGQQEFAAENGHYSDWWYLPVVVKRNFGDVRGGAWCDRATRRRQERAIPMLWRLLEVDPILWTIRGPLYKGEPIRDMMRRFPRLVDEMRRRLGGLPESAQRKMLGENALRFYGLAA